MHDPVSPSAMGGLSSVKNQSFLHPRNLFALRSHNLLVYSSCFPVAGACGSVGSVPIGILGFSGAEKVAFLLQIT